LLNRLGALGTLWGLMAEAARTSPRKTAASAVLMLVLTLTEGAGLLLLAPLLELVGVMEQNPMPRAAGWLDRAFASVGIEVTLGSVLLLFVALAGALTMLRWVEARLVAGAREDLASAYRNRIYRAMAAAEWRFLVTRTPAEFAHVLTSEIGRVSKAVTQVTNLGILILAAVVYLALAVRLSPSMAALVLVSAAVLAWSVRGTLNRARALGARAASTTRSPSRSRASRRRAATARSIATRASSRS
jgi:ATP-binding cassette subfamily C protein